MNIVIFCHTVDKRENEKESTTHRKKKIKMGGIEGKEETESEGE